MRRFMDAFWFFAAKIISRPVIADWLIRRAMKTPYCHIPARNGEGDNYMERYWVFNPYSRQTHEGAIKWFPWSLRVHWIRRKDDDGALHDHPWDARTVILKGSYLELDEHGRNYVRAGMTKRIDFEHYHQITWVPDEGVWTLFITGKYRGDWGFLVDGIKVPWQQYLKFEQQAKEN